MKEGPSGSAIRSLIPSHRFFPRYNRMMAGHGFVEEAAAIAAARSRSDRDAAERAVSDELTKREAGPRRSRA